MCAPSWLADFTASQLTRVFAAQNITTERIIEDPVFKPSDRSYLIQMADCVAFALLKSEVPPTPNVARYGIHEMFDKTLRGICFKPASPRDPLGIVRY